MLVKMELNKIYQGDVIDVLNTFPDECVDIIVTSPPYNKQGAKGKLVKEVDYDTVYDSMPENLYQLDQIAVLNELHRVTKPYGHIFYNHKLRWTDGNMIHPMEWIKNTEWNIRQEIVWDKIIAANIRGWRFWQVEERIYWMQKGIKKGEELESRHAKMSSIWRMRPESKFPEHPAPFPVELPTRCIYSVADLKKGLTVLDPYSGTGSTLVAASIIGHNYVGIDCSNEYIKIAEERLKDPTEIDRVCIEMNLHNVNKSYKDRKKSKLLKK